MVGSTAHHAGAARLVVGSIAHHAAFCVGSIAHLDAAVGLASSNSCTYRACIRLVTRWPWHSLGKQLPVPHDTAPPVDQRVFLYMPYMHSESQVIHTDAVRLFSSLDRSENYDFELRHKAILDRFGRYPHRNAVLGRVSTPEELEFLKEPGSRF